MMRAFRSALILPAVLALAACGQMGGGGSRTAVAPPSGSPAPVTPGRVISSNPLGSAVALPAAQSPAAAAASADAAGARPM